VVAFAICIQDHTAFHDTNGIKDFITSATKVKLLIFSVNATPFQKSLGGITCPKLEAFRGSSVASPKCGGGEEKFGRGDEMFDFRRITLFGLGYRLSGHKTMICSKDLEVMAP